MKTFLPLLFAAALAADLAGQAPTNLPSIPRRINRAEMPAPGSPVNPGAMSPPPGLSLPAPNTAAPTSNAPLRLMTNMASRPTNVASRFPSFRGGTNVPGGFPRTAPQMPGTRPQGAPSAPGVVPPPAPGGSGTAAENPPALSVPIAPPATALSAAGTNEVAGDEETVYPPGLIKLNEADLSSVLQVYQELTGRTVMRANLPAVKITITTQTALTRREAIQALDTILSLNGISMVPQGDKFVKAVPQAQVGTEAKQFNELKIGDLPESGTPVSQIVRITNQMPREVAAALQPFAKLPNSILAIDSAGILILRDYSENVKRMMEVLQQIDVVPQQEFIDVVIPIKYALAGDIAQVLGTLTAGGGTTTVGKQQTRTGLTGAGGGGFGSSSGTGSLGGAGGFGNTGMQGNTMGGIGGSGGLGSSTAGRSSFASRLAGIVNRAVGQGGDIVILGTTKIIADERTNSLLIFASKMDLVTISNIIEKLDVVLPQVLIEAIIMEVSLGDNLDYGVNYLQRQATQSGNFTGIGAIKNTDFLGNVAGVATNASSAFPGGFSYAARWGNDFDITATAAASDSRVNVLSKPRIQTSHAVEANLFVGRTRPYVTGTYYSYGGGPSTQFQQQQIGITLSVLPLINPDGLVVMDIRQRIQSIGREIAIDANFKVPETIDREANAKVSVRDKETIMLGGFISNERTRSKSGVPILKDIPILGNLFSNNSRKDDRSELIVMIRPTVLPNPADAALTALEEKAKLPGVSAAEREFDRADKKRLEKANKELRKEGRK